MSAIENNFILARSKEHKFILETLGELESILKVATKEEFIPDLKSVIARFHEEMQKHQTLEENVIFKAALEAIPSPKVINLILALQKEHGEFLASIDSLTFLLYTVEIDNKVRLHIENTINRITLTIKKHSLLEVKELFPLLSVNARCKQLVDSYSKAFS